VFFSLLGPLRVLDGERAIRVVAPKHRALLALLLLRRGEPVSVESLGDELWAGEPPATATKAVRVYVAQLRKALGSEVVVTVSGGYALPLDGHETDVGRFEALVSEGRRHLDAGDANRAATLLRAALALWRGPALSDFRYEEFAQPEAARLEEARLGALEARIEADLAFGREDELVPELQALVREHPLRERLRWQLMLALYRAGRQAEALDAYRNGRQLLVEELGIEPGRELQDLERAILAQDASIGVPRQRLRSAARRRPAVLLALGGGLIVAAAAAAVAVTLTHSGEGGVSSVVQGNSVAAVDPGSGRVVAEVPVGATPAAVAVGEGAVWVLNADDQTVSRIDPRTKGVRTLGIGATPTDVAAGAGSVWIGNGGELGGAQFAGTTATAVTRLDPRTGAVRATVALPRVGSARSNIAQSHIAVAGGSVWAIAPDFSLVRIDPDRGEITDVSRDVAATAVVAGRGAVWVLDDRGTVVRLDARSARVTRRVPVPAVGLSALAVGAGSVWATDPYQGTLWRIDPAPRVVQRTIDVGAGADSVAFGEGSVWVGNSLQGTLTRVEPATNRVERTIPLGNTPRAVAVGEGLVWVAVAGERAIPASSSASGSSVQVLPDTMCGPLVSGSEPPRFIVASDLPLRGGPRFVTPQMSAAVLHVLRRRGFRAGRYAIGYQSCDHSTAQTGLFDERKCAANAKAYAANLDVIGVVGPYNSGCAYPSIPIANRAGLAIVSPTNSDVGLTRAALGAPRGLLRTLHPTGRRTYARLMSPDDAEAAADVQLARQLGARTVFVLDDGGYGRGIAAYFKREAAELELRVVGSSAWNPHRPRAGALAERVRRSGAEAVFLCGLIDSGVGEVLAAIRRELPASLPVIGCDLLLPVSLLFEQARPAARGTYVSIKGLVNERLGTAGKAFLRDFGATQPGARVDIASIYAAQAADLLLDAIARSDGTRASVSSELLRASVQGGLLGSFSIDRNGDPTPTPVTIVRVEHGRGTNLVASYDGARVDRVITPRRR
jgi:DNA-binding SARP family transcriptional activator/ABC-type branched-subunit amino acid transport system substrate-binding protein/sugar lactone lactonase YvrE